MYGAGNKKLALTAGLPENTGAKIKRNFYKAHPGIKELIDDLEEAYDRKKWIKGLDGRPLFIRQKNRLLNTLLQNAATVVFKRWMVQLGELAVNEEQIIAYHDELQYEVPEEVAEGWAAVCEDTAKAVGIELKIRVPIEAEAKIGMNWGEC